MLLHSLEQCLMVIEEIERVMFSIPVLLGLQMFQFFHSKIFPQPLLSIKLLPLAQFLVVACLACLQ